LENVQTNSTQSNFSSFGGPLFVVGMWRSGTSLLYALLNQHPQIALLYEGDLALLSPLFWFTNGKADWQARWDFWNSALQRHHVDPARIPAKVSSWAEAMASVGREYARRKGAQIWGCKSPNYFDSMTRLSREFPEAKFIVIWRNPADICRSILRAAENPGWFRKSGLPNRALFGCREMKKECDQLLASGVPVHEIEYEELTRTPDAVMDGVRRFLDIPYDEHMTSLEGADRSAIYEGDHHSLVKSERIVYGKERKEVLSPALRSKIGRYISLWRAESGGRWPKVELYAQADMRQPGFLERCLDRFIYRSLRMIDFGVILTFCFAPRILLNKYRKLKAKRQTASKLRGDVQRAASSRAD
jgi:hypothetical protein